MKQLFLSLFIMSMSLAHAQTFTALYAVGSAVPEGIVQLVPYPDGSFKFAGELNEGNLLIRTTEQHKSSAYYLKPKYEDSYIVNHGLAYTMSRDTTSSWYVPVSEGRYRFSVNPSAKVLTGELFTPWNELFVVGGATKIGWESYIMLPFTRDDDELCTWEWEGELKNRPEHNEPRRFKLTGQNAWEPKALHPFTVDEDVLSSQYVLTNGVADNKWQTTKDGYYRLRVDVFRETITARYLGTNGASDSTDPTAIHSLPSLPSTTSSLFNLAGQRVGEGSKGVRVNEGRKCLMLNK